jgi:octaprenyl-diphosphate synthase
LSGPVPFGVHPLVRLDAHARQIDIDRVALAVPVEIAQHGHADGQHSDHQILCGHCFPLVHSAVRQIRTEHFEIIRRKTAYLFGGCAQIGGLLGNVSPEREQALREYGFNLGVAFQLVDDLLDYTADQEALGKPIGGDLREGKVTLPIIFLRERGGEPAYNLIREVVAEKAVTPEQWREILRLLDEHRATEFAYARAVEYAERAKECLSVFPPGRERDALAALPDYVLARDR